MLGAAGFPYLEATVAFTGLVYVLHTWLDLRQKKVGKSDRERSRAELSGLCNPEASHPRRHRHSAASPSRLGVLLPPVPKQVLAVATPRDAVASIYTPAEFEVRNDVHAHGPSCRHDAAHKDVHAAACRPFHRPFYSPLSLSLSFSFFFTTCRRSGGTIWPS